MTPRPWVTLCAFAVGTASIALAVAWPTTTHADGAGPLVQYMVDGTKIDDVVASGKVHRDAHAASGWVIDVKARNGAAHEESIPLDTELRRTSNNPMARVLPFPQIVWREHEQVTVPAGGTVTRRYEVPADVAQQLAAAEADAKSKPSGKAKALPMGLRPMISFAVAFDGVGMPGAPQPMLPPAAR